MKHHDFDGIRQMVEKLDALGADGYAECVIAAETSLSESVLLGTSEGFVALATVLLRLVLAELSNSTVGDAAPDEDGIRSMSTARLFYEFGSAWPVSAMIAPDKEQYEEWKRRLLTSL